MDGAPKLTEPGVRSFVGKSLRDYHKYRDGFTSMLFNIAMLAGFVVTVAGILYWRYKGRITPQEQALKKPREERVYLHEAPDARHDEGACEAWYDYEPSDVE